MRGVAIDERGFTLVEALLALLLLGIGSAVMASALGHHVQGQAAISRRADLNAVKQTLLQSFDCAASLGSPTPDELPLSCDAYARPGEVAIRGKRGTPLTSKDHLGRWKVRAYCADGGVRFKVDSDSAPGRSTKDPLTNRDLATDDLFGGAGNFCANYFAGTKSRYACGAGQFVTAIDPATLAVTCSDASTLVRTTSLQEDDVKKPQTCGGNGWVPSGIAVDKSGQIGVTCTPGQYFGGSYTVLADPGSGLPGGSCLQPNPAGGGCACPGGFSAQIDFKWVRQCGWSGPWDMSREPWGVYVPANTNDNIHLENQALAAYASEAAQQEAACATPYYLLDHFQNGAWSGAYHFVCVR
jgi:prepilin-type N-terminal cleavage/methylation domain-containing protein